MVVGVVRGGVDTFTSSTLPPELYLSFNHLSELDPLAQLDDLEVLDLEGNRCGALVAGGGG
jgi:hypothetical protein